MEDKYKHLPKTRKEAKALGVPYYFNGVPCKHGHIDRRRTHNSSCAKCESKVRKKNKSPNKFASKKHQKTKQRLIHPNQMPSWADKEKIKGMLIKAKESGLVLDHVIPLKGKVKSGSSVCGLHCEDNLVAVTYEQNNKKSFNEWPDMWIYSEPRYKRLPEDIKRINALKSTINKINNIPIGGIKWNKRRNHFVVYDIKKRYLGSTIDYFIACCMRKSSDTRNIQIFKSEIFSIEEGEGQPYKLIL